MSSNLKVKVTSRSFSQNEYLKNLVLSKYPSASFNEAGEVFTFERLCDFLSDADMAIIGLEKMNKEVLEKCPKLKHIAKYGVGIDNITLPDLKAAKVTFGFEGGVNKHAVAELTLAHMLSLVRNLHGQNALAKKLEWKSQYTKSLSEMTVGLLGMGHIGKEVVKRLRPFNCQIMYYDLLESDPQWGKKETLENLLRQCDIVSIHLPKTSQTLNLLNDKTLPLLKKGALLINTARGGIVDEVSLYRALSERHLQAAAFDVLNVEPPKEFGLLQLPNFYCTPHIGGSSSEAIKAMGESAIRSLSIKTEAQWGNYFSYPE